MASLGLYSCHHPSTCATGGLGRLYNLTGFVDWLPGLANLWEQFEDWTPTSVGLIVWTMTFLSWVGLPPQEEVQDKHWDGELEEDMGGGWMEAAVNHKENIMFKRSGVVVMLYYSFLAFFPLLLSYILFLFPSYYHSVWCAHNNPSTPTTYSIINSGDLNSSCTPCCQYFLLLWM